MKMTKVGYFGIVVAAFAVGTLVIETAPVVTALMIVVMAWATFKGELWDAGE